MSKTIVVYAVVHSDYDTYDIKFVTLDYDTACFFRDKWNEAHRIMQLQIDDYELDKDEYNIL